MIKKNYRKYMTTHYIVMTGIMIALLMVLASLTIFIKFGNSSFQIADALFLALIPIIPGPMMLIVGLIYPVFFDLITGGLIFIPLSIIIHSLMFFMIKGLQQWISIYLLLIFCGCLIFSYVPYNYLLNLNLGLETAQGMAIRELIVDSVQFGLTIGLAIVLEIIFFKSHFKNYIDKKITKDF